MSAFPGKVRILGIVTLRDMMDEKVIDAVRENLEFDFLGDPNERMLVCDFIQARKRSWIKKPFFAKFDEDAAWFDELRPAFGRDTFYFESDDDREQSYPLFSLTESLLE